MAEALGKHLASDVFESYSHKDANQVANQSSRNTLNERYLSN